MGRSHLTGQHPVEQTDGVASLVVGRDGNIHESQRRVGIAESNDWDVHVRRLADWLVVGARISEHKEARLLVVLLDVVSEQTRGEAASNVLGTSVLSVLEHGTLSVWTSRDHAHVSGVLDGDDDAGSEHHLLPGLGEIDHIHACRQGDCRPQFGNNYLALRARATLVWKGQDNIF